MSLDEDPAKEFDALIAKHGYTSRSQAMRDLLRQEIKANRARYEPRTRCVASLSNVYDHHLLDPAKRLTGSRHVERRVLTFSASEWARLAALYGFIACLHVFGWGLFLYYSSSHPAMVGLGFVAYMFGLRHAFDADHIVSVDDTVRYMLQKGKQPLGVGFFFSLGHSTVVLVLAVAVAFAATAIKNDLSFPRFIVFQGLGIKPPYSACAES